MNKGRSRRAKADVVADPLVEAAGNTPLGAVATLGLALNAESDKKKSL